MAAPALEDTPVYAAGLNRGDELLSVDGVALTSRSRLDEAVERHRPGDNVRLSIRRRGVVQELTLTIGEDPRLELVPVERTGRPLSAAETEFRRRWLGSRRSPHPSYTANPMSEESTRNWTRTYLAVIVVEILALAGLWLLQRHYGT